MHHFLNYGEHLDSSFEIEVLLKKKIIRFAFILLKDTARYSVKKFYHIGRKSTETSERK